MTPARPHLVFAHAFHAGDGSPLLLWVLVLAAVVSGVLVAAAVAAYARRRERSFLLVVGAFAALFARTVVALLALLAVIPGALHHVLEHALDVVMAGLVVAAVYYARRVERG